MKTLGRKARIKILTAALRGILSNGCRATVVMAGIVTPEEDFDAAAPGPLDPFNQKMFRVTLQFDERIMRPAATCYARVVPGAARHGVGRFLRNLGVIERVVNNLLQGKVCRAGQEVGRFVINTTLGGGGFFDVADRLYGAVQDAYLQRREREVKE